METCTFDVASLSSSPKIGGAFGFNGSRDVWAITYDGVPCVVKYDPRGYQNGPEIATWDKVKYTGIAHYFAPILAHSEDNKFLVMERVEKVLSEYDPQLTFGGYHLNDEALDKRYYEFRHHIEADCDKMGIDADDLHPGNVGIRADGTLAVIDYGYFDRSQRWLGSDDCSCERCRRQRSSNDG